MRIVVLDGHTLNPDGDNPWDPLARLGELVIYPNTSDDQVAEQAAAAEIIVDNKAAIREPTFAKLLQLKFITITATGYNIVDIDAAAMRGIPVSNVPNYATDSVAQFTIALLLELCHRVGLHDQAVKAGEWTRTRDFAFWKTRQTELAGKTFGIIGFGRIGQRVGELAHAFGMKVLAYSPSTKPSPAYAPFAFGSLEQVFSESDVVSLHAPLTPQNHAIVNSSLLGRMKRSAFLLNTSRGQLVNEQDLAAALDSGAIAGAAVDVVSAEPMKPDNPLLTARNIIITPHMAWAAVEPRRRVMKVTADNIAAFLAGKPINVVNAAQLSGQT